MNPLQIYFEMKLSSLPVVIRWGGYPMANGGPKEVKLDETSINKSKFNIVDMVTGSTHCLLLSG